MVDKIDLTGRTFGRLTVLSQAPSIKKMTMWSCVCECGNHHITQSKRLRNGNNRSCGCLANEMRRTGQMHRVHGDAANNGQNSPEYRVWCHIKSRCFNPNVPGYEYYGGRGISMFDQWINDYPAFLKHVGRRPFPSYTIERIDNDKGYEPGNVKWASRIDQGRNRRHITMTVSDAAAIRIAVANGESRRSVQSRFSTTKAIVANIVRNKTWQ